MAAPELHVLCLVMERNMSRLDVSSRKGCLEINKPKVSPRLEKSCLVSECGKKFTSHNESSKSLESRFLLRLKSFRKFLSYLEAYFFDF